MELFANLTPAEIVLCFFASAAAVALYRAVQADNATDID